MNDYAQSNGLRRNLKKMRYEYNMLKYDMAPYWQEFAEKPDTHNYVDLFVESGRYSLDNPNYFMGHIWSIYFPISLWVIAYLAGGWPVLIGFNVVVALLITLLWAKQKFDVNKSIRLKVKARQQRLQEKIRELKEGR